jgi:hypothetical protein
VNRDTYRHVPWQGLAVTSPTNQATPQLPAEVLVIGVRKPFIASTSGSVNVNLANP